jgi:hypothetical protein
MAKKYKQILWGFKYPSGTILIGHDRIPVVNHTRKETRRICDNTPDPKPRPVRLIIEEK